METLSNPVLAELAEGDVPESVRSIVQLIGLAATLQLVDQLGGLQIPIPKGETHTQGHLRFEYLAEVVGRSGAQALCARYGGTTLAIPNCRTALVRVRNRHIVMEYDAGESVHALARKHQLTDRMIRRILKTTDTHSSRWQDPPDDRQLGFAFDP